MTQPAEQLTIELNTGPRLLYVHAQSPTATCIDREAITDPRERAICRALLQHALALLDASEPTRTNGAAR